MFILPSIEIQSALESILEKIGEITLHLHQLTELEALLQYGVREIQELFGSDRALVYRFLPTDDGVVIAESVRAGWQPIIGQLIYDPCFQNQWAAQYRQGRVSQVSDVEQSDLAPCYIEFLTQLQVKANLVVPILIRQPANSPIGGEPDDLWGLLIVQQCSAPRTWHSLEVQIFKQLTQQLEIAIAHLEAQNPWLTTAAQLHQSEAYLRQIIDQSPVALVAFAPDGTFNYASPAWETLWQTSREQLIGYNPLHDPQFIASEQGQFWQRAQAGEAVTSPPMYYNPALSGNQGRPLWIQAHLYPLKDEAETVQEILVIQYDVTEQVTAEQERDRFFSNSHDLMMIIDQDNIITQANPAWQTILGYSPTELVGVRYLDLLHPEDVYTALEVMQQHRLTQQPILNCERRCRHQDHSYRWISWNALYDNGLLYAFGRDITQQKQLEESLKQQEERWQLAIRGSNDGIWDWNILSDELFISPRWKEMLGYSDDQIENARASWESRLHPDDVSRVKQAVQDHLSRKTPFYEVEKRMRCKDGTYKWILARAQAVWDETGRAVRMVGSHTDISDRKQVELSLQEREETLRLLIKYAPANIAMFDQDMNYLMITQRGVENCQNGSIESVLGRSHYEVVPRAAQWQQVHQRCLAGAIEKCDESLVVREDGTPYWTRWEIHPWYKANQEVGGIILFIEDITPQKQAEQELKRSVEELTRLNQLKDDFLSTVSHELRTPMSNIKMATHMLEISLKSLGILEDHLSSTNRYFQILKAECQRETQLINNLLDLTHLNAGTEPLIPTSVNLSYLIPHLAEPFIERVKEHQQSLELVIPNNLPAITTDLTYLERIISELLNNSCKYTPAGEMIRLSVQATLETLEISISNSGIEISEIECNRIFDKFYRIPNHDPWKYGGTGLGLTLVKNMVNRLGGMITASSSSQPCMTMFTVNLPFNLG